MGFFLVMKAELVRNFIVMRRYWFRTLTGLFLSYGMLMVLVYGFISAGDQASEAVNSRFQDASSATNFVLGFIIGMFAFAVVGMFSQGLQGMARTGVLEQLCMSPHGLIVNFLARSVVASISLIISSSILVWAVSYSVNEMLDTGAQLYFDTPAVLALLLLTFFNLLGFGFMVGGLVLVFKQIGQIAILLRMALFALAIFAKEELLTGNVVMAAILHALPITDAAICLKYVLIEGQGAATGDYMSVFQHSSFYFLLGSCMIWTLIGMTCFRLMEDWSRAKGTLGAY